MDDLFQVSFWLPQEWAFGTYTLHTFDCLVKCSWSLYVGNNRERELVTVIAMAPPYLVCGPLVSNGSSHIVTTVEEGIQNMSGNETGPSRNENSLALADIFDTIKDVLYFGFDGCHVQVWN
jgi:hypothetical protein